MRKLIICGVAALALAGCGGSSTPDPAATHTTAPTLTSSQGAAICNDLNAWIAQAENQDQPRFSPALEADETQAAGSTLGSDLQAEDADLQQDNSLALQPGVIYNQQGVSNTTALSADCSAYGVTLNWGP